MPRGRPPWDWRTDPDRFAIALADALQALGANEREAFDCAVAAFDTSGPQSMEPAKDMPAGLRPALQAVSFVLRSEPGAPATIKGRAATLRQKSKKTTQLKSKLHHAPAGFVEWRTFMAKAFLCALRPKASEVAKHFARQFAAMAEQVRARTGMSDGADLAFAERVLVPMIDAKFQAADFITSDK